MRRGCLRAVAIAGAALIVAFGLSALALLPDTRQERRFSAQQRWEQRHFADYQIKVEVERLGKSCVEELAIRGEQIDTLHDSCALGWLPNMTVPTLFQLSQRLERAPECYPASACACQRVRSGRVVYDPELGYPREIAIERYVRPHWSHPDYWAALLDTWRLPQCSNFTTGIAVRVLELKPLR